MIMQAGLMCFTRAERGAAESAACGMLATARAEPREQRAVLR